MKILNSAEIQQIYHPQSVSSLPNIHVTVALRVLFCQKNVVIAGCQGCTEPGSKGWNSGP